GGTLPAGFQNLAALSGDALVNALNQLSGQPVSGITQNNIQAGSLFLTLMLNPFNTGRSGGAGLRPTLTHPREQQSRVARDASAAYASVLPPSQPTFDQRYGYWAQAYGASGTINGDANAGTVATTSHVYGFASGLDYRFAPDLVAGFALGGGTT